MYLIILLMIIFYPIVSPPHARADDKTGIKLELAEVENMMASGALIMARQKIEPLVARYPDDWRARLVAARIYRQMGLTSFAIDTYERVRRLRPDLSEPLVALSRLYLDNLSTELALGLARQAVAVDPGSLDARLALAEALVACQSIQSAQVQSQKLARDFADDVRVLHLQAQVARAAGKTEQARDFLIRALATKEISTDWLMELAQINVDLGHYAAAEASLQRILTINPDSFTANLRLAQLYELKMHDYVKAIGAYKKVQELAPDSVEAQTGLQRSLACQADWALCLKNFVHSIFR
jgi:tetratricopeptide (TPR) repeat protein